MRCEEDGWRRVGIYCTAHRRALWVRFGDAAVELCAGREGDDAHVKIHRRHPDYVALMDVLSYATYAEESS